MTSLDTVSAILSDLKEYVGNEFGEMKKRQDHTNGRLRVVERFQYVVIGFCICMSALVLPVSMRVIGNFVDTVFAAVT